MTKTSFTIRPITAKDDADIQQIIETVGREFGAIGDGFGPSDNEVCHMSQYYGQDKMSQYWVVDVAGQVVGGGGIAGFDPMIMRCELRKLFILPQYRGDGLGKALLQHALTFAKQAGYRDCYLDTLSTMTQAITLYEREGFTHLFAPAAVSIHCGCDVWMLKTL